MLIPELEAQELGSRITSEVPSALKAWATRRPYRHRTRWRALSRRARDAHGHRVRGPNPEDFGIRGPVKDLTKTKFFWIQILYPNFLLKFKFEKRSIQTFF